MSVVYPYISIPNTQSTASASTYLLGQGIYSCMYVPGRYMDIDLPVSPYGGNSRHQMRGRKGIPRRVKLAPTTYHVTPKSTRKITPTPSEAFQSRCSPFSDTVGRISSSVEHGDVQRSHWWTHFHAFTLRVYHLSRKAALKCVRWCVLPCVIHGTSTSCTAPVHGTSAWYAHGRYAHGKATHITQRGKAS